MARVYPLTFPTIIGITDISWHAISSDVLTMSPQSFAQQVIDNGGQRFDVDVMLPPLTRAEGNEFVAFALELNGRVGTFLFTPPEGATARGSASSTPGTPVINGASQTGDSVNIDGLPNSATGYLLAGDNINLGTGSGTELYKCVNDVNSDGSGLATVDIWPDLRSAPADGSAVVVANAKGLFRMASPQIEWAVDVRSIYGMALTFMDAL